MKEKPFVTREIESPIPGSACQSVGIDREGRAIAIVANFSFAVWCQCLVGLSLSLSLSPSLSVCFHGEAGAGEGGDQYPE